MGDRHEEYFGSYQGRPEKADTRFLLPAADDEHFAAAV